VFEGPLATFLLTAGVGLLLAFLSWLIARRSGLLPLQSELVDTLQDTVAALDRQLTDTKAELKAALAKLAAAQTDTMELSDALNQLARENAVLRRKFGQAPRRRTDVERRLDL
jgi:chromosome segregation ATPase